LPKKNNHFIIEPYMNRRKLVVLLCSLIITASAVVSGVFIVSSSKNNTPEVVEAAAATNGLFTTSGVYNQTGYPSVGWSGSLGIDTVSWKCVYKTADRGGYATFIRTSSIGTGYYSLGGNGSYTSLPGATVYNVGYYNTSYTGLYGGCWGSLGSKDTTSGGTAGPGYNVSSGYIWINSKGQKLYDATVYGSGTVLYQIQQYQNTRFNYISSVVHGSTLMYSYPQYTGVSSIPYSYTTSNQYAGSVYGGAIYGTTRTTYSYISEYIWLPDRNQIAAWGSNVAFMSNAWLRALGIDGGTVADYYDGGSRKSSDVRNVGKNLYPCVTLKMPADRYTVTLDPVYNTGTQSLTTTVFMNTGSSTLYRSADLNNFASYSPIVVPSRQGYTFNGYYTGANGTGTRIISASGYPASAWSSAGGGNLYAYWTRNPLSVSVNNGTHSIVFDEGMNSYKVTVRPSQGYYFSSYSGSGITVQGNSIPLNTPAGNDSEFNVIVQATASSGASINFYFLPIPLTKGTETNGTISIGATGPPYTVILDPNSGFHLTGVSVAKSNEAYSGTPRAPTATSNDNDGSKTLAYTPSVRSSVFNAAFEKNHLTAALSLIGGSVEVVSGTGGNWQITATPNPGYRVAAIEAIKDGYSGVTAVPDFVLPTITVPITLDYIPNYHNTIITAEFLPNELGTPSSTAKWGDPASGTNSCVGGSVDITPISKPFYKITVSPNNGYSVGSIKLSSGATSDVEPLDSGAVGRTALSDIYQVADGTVDGGSGGTAIGTRNGQVVEVYVRPNTNGAVVEVEFLKNFVNVGTVTDTSTMMDGSDILSTANEISGENTDANAIISLISDSSNGYYDVMVKTKSGYRVTNISLSGGADGLTQPNLYNEIEASKLQDANGAETRYTNTEAWVKVRFYSTIHNVDVNATIERNILHLSGSAVTVPTNANYKQADNQSVPGVLGVTAKRYEYLHGSVYVVDYNDPSTDNPFHLGYKVYAQPNAGYRVTSVQMSNSTYGWVDNTSSVNALASYRTYNYNYDFVIYPSKYDETLTVTFTSNTAIIGSVNFRGRTGDFSGPGTTTSQKRADLETAATLQEQTTSCVVKTLDGISANVGEVTISWDNGNFWYRLLIKPMAGYTVKNIRTVASSSPIGGTDSSLKETATKSANSNIKPAPYSGSGIGSSYYPGKTETMYVILIPNSNNMSVHVDFEAIHAIIDQGQTETNGYGGKVTLYTEPHAPFYSVIAVPNPGFIVEGFSVSSPGLHEIPDGYPFSYNIDANNPKYEDGVVATFTAKYEAMKIMVTFKKNVIEVDTQATPNSVVNGTMVTNTVDVLHGTVMWASDSKKATITLTITPADGWRVAGNSIKFAAYNTETGNLDTKYSPNPVTFEEGEGGKQSEGFLIRNVSFGQTYYGESSDKIEITFTPMWNNAVISVSFEWNTILYDDVEIYNNAAVLDTTKISYGNVDIGSYNTDIGFQKIVIIPLAGYRITEIKMVQRTDSTKDVNGIYLADETDSTFDKPSNKREDKMPDVAGAGGTTVYQNWSHNIEFWVRPYWNNAKLLVTFTPNLAKFSSIDETKKSLSSGGLLGTDSARSQWGTLTQVPMGELGSNGLYYKAVATPKSGYKFVGWAIYLTTDGVEFDWDNYNNIEYSNPSKQIIEKSQINGGVNLGGESWDDIDDNAYLTTILTKGKFNFAPNHIYTILKNYGIRVQNGSVYDGYGGHLATEYETDGYYGDNGINDYSLRTSTQTVYFTPQYNGLTLVAMFEILTPTILTAPEVTHPIYDGKTQWELLMNGTTQSWAEIQYGYINYDETNIDKKGEIDWNLWLDAKSGEPIMPTQLNVVYMVEDRGSTINGYLVGDDDFVSGDIDNGKVIIRTIYYRAIHITGTNMSTRTDENNRRPTAFTNPSPVQAPTYDNEVLDATIPTTIPSPINEPYDDIDNIADSDGGTKGIDSNGSPITSQTPKVVDVRVLPLPISFFFTEAAGGPFSPSLKSPDDIKGMYNSGVKTTELQGLHNGLEPSGSGPIYTQYTSQRNWLNNKVLVGGVSSDGSSVSTTKRMPVSHNMQGTAIEYQYDQKGWDQRYDTSVILGMAFYDKKEATNAAKPENSGIDIKITQPDQVAKVLWKKLQITGDWYGYTKNIYSKTLDVGDANYYAFNGTTARGNFMAKGNFAGYLYDVPSFEISDNTALVVYRSLRDLTTDTRDEILKGNPEEKVYKTTKVIMGYDKRILKEPMMDKKFDDDPNATYDERTKNYTYSFLGWSRTPQVWDVVDADATVVSGDLADDKGHYRTYKVGDVILGTYMTDWAWGINSNGEYEAEHNTQTVANPEDREIVYYAIYSRAMRTYKISFRYYKPGLIYGEFTSFTYHYGERFYVNRICKEMSEVVPNGFPYDVYLGTGRFVFITWWDITESYWHTDPDMEVSTPEEEQNWVKSNKYLIIEHDWLFDATYFYTEHPTIPQGEK
jgi:hypothetical protein